MVVIILIMVDSSILLRCDLIPSFGTKLSMIFAKERGESMSRSRHTEAQMIGALKQVEAWRAVEDVAREVGFRSTRSMPGKRSMVASIPESVTFSPFVAGYR
jgi:hypothetical protein